MPNWIRFPKINHDPNDSHWESRFDWVYPVSVDQAKTEATNGQSCFFVYCNGDIQVDNNDFQPQSGICFRTVPLFVPEPNTDLYLRELTPRNIIWVSDCPPTKEKPDNKFTPEDKELLQQSTFTHAIICFFHLGLVTNKDDPKNPLPQLVYNNAGDPNNSEFDTWWEYLRGLRQRNNYKTLMLSVGGFGVNDWENAKGKNGKGNEEAFATLLVNFAQSHGFAGIDFNFEGFYRNRDDLLSTLAKMVVEVRKQMRQQQWDGLFTITPMRDNLNQQLLAIQNAVQIAEGRLCPLSDYVSWINLMFYLGDDPPKPDTDVAEAYNKVLAGESYWGESLSDWFPLPPKMVSAGFPLSKTDVKFNQGELVTAASAVKAIKSKHPNFAGLFVWRFRYLRAGEKRLDWDGQFTKILQTPYRQFGPGA